MRCASCSFENAAGAAVCQRCGAPLGNPFSSPQAPLGPPPQGGDDAVSVVIPYKNAAALLAYYLGLFSCFPIIGFPMAIVALVCGVKGLKAVSRNPNIHGTAHAWVGLICGTIGFLINAMIIFAIVAALISEAGR